jgi:hypothetical protein
VAEQSEEQLLGIMANGDKWLRENFGLNLGHFFVPTKATAWQEPDRWRVNNFQKNRALAINTSPI